MKHQRAAFFNSVQGLFRGVLWSDVQWGPEGNVRKDLRSISTLFSVLCVCRREGKGELPKGGKDVY